MPADRILELGADDNFWQMGDTGPCGRCSEIYYVRGTGSDPEIEIWNNVFMEFERSADGTLTPLPAPSIDTGMGLERITAVLQQKDSNYDTDLFTPLLTAIGELAGVPLRRRRGARDISMRVVADHIRATTFLIARRRHPVERVARLRAAQDHAARDAPRQAPRASPSRSCTGWSRCSTARWATPIPSCARNREMIEKTILAEENRFEAVLTDGLPRLEAEIAKALGTHGEGAVRRRRVPASTTPSACRTTSSRTRRRRRASTVDRDGFERGDGRRSATRRARGSAFGGGKKGEEFASPTTQRRSQAPAISSRATRRRA